MSNGFAFRSLTRSFRLPVDSLTSLRIVRPLRSTAISAASSLLGTVRPRVLARYSPLRFLPL